MCGSPVTRPGWLNKYLLSVKECRRNEGTLTVEVLLLGPADFVRGGLAHGFVDR